MNTKCCSSYCLTGNSALIFSPSLERQTGHIGLAARAASGCGSSLHLEPVHLAAVGKAQHGVVRMRDEQLLDEVLVLDRVAVLPRPPRRCVWYSVSGWLLA